MGADLCSILMERSMTDYDQPATQAEWRWMLKDTMHGRAMADEGFNSGRFTKQNAARVTGSTPVPSYPQLPASSPWHSWPSPPEPVLGYDINAVEPVGSPTEIAASMKEQGDAADE
jgi:hypothetical protein